MMWNRYERCYKLARTFTSQPSGTARAYGRLMLCMIPPTNWRPLAVSSVQTPRAGCLQATNGERDRPTLRCVDLSRIFYDSFCNWMFTCVCMCTHMRVVCGGLLGPANWPRGTLLCSTGVGWLPKTELKIPQPHDGESHQRIQGGYGWFINRGISRLLIVCFFLVLSSITNHWLTINFRTTVCTRYCK